MAIKHSVFLPSGFSQELAHLPDPVEAFEAISGVARAADDHGYEGVYVLDHLVTIPPSRAPLFECWTTAAALARDTTRVRIGQLVTGNGYRNPALQAKMAATMDVLSHGRFTFGIGAGWYEPDYAGYGYAYEDAPERLRRLREAVEIIRSMLTEAETTFAGGYYRVTGAVNEPPGVQRPHVPMLIAGAGEKVTLKLVARFGDACNVIESPARLAHKYAVLRDHCEDAGRDPGEIRRTAVAACLMADTDAEARDRLPAEHPLFPG